MSSLFTSSANRNVRVSARHTQNLTELDETFDSEVDDVKSFLGGRPVDVETLQPGTEGPGRDRRRHAGTEDGLSLACGSRSSPGTYDVEAVLVGDAVFFHAKKIRFGTLPIGCPTERTLTGVKAVTERMVVTDGEADAEPMQDFLLSDNEEAGCSTGNTTFSLPAEWHRNGSGHGRQMELARDEPV